MDPGKPDVTEAAVRPHREQRLPQHLSEYELGYIPTPSAKQVSETKPPSVISEHTEPDNEPPPSVISEHTHSEPDNEPPPSVRSKSSRRSEAKWPVASKRSTRESSHHSKDKSISSIGSSKRSTRESSHHSRDKSISSIGSHRSAGGTDLRRALTPIQEALLQENIHRLELEQLQHEVFEDSRADLECQSLNAKAREAQRQQQETQDAREAIAKRLDRQRRLKEKEKELQVAQLLSSLLREPVREEVESPVPSTSNFRPLPTSALPTDSVTLQRPVALRSNQQMQAHSSTSATVKQPSTQSMPLSAAPLEPALPASTVSVMPASTQQLPSQFPVSTTVTLPTVHSLSQSVPSSAFHTPATSSQTLLQSAQSNAGITRMSFTAARPVTTYMNTVMSAHHDHPSRSHQATAVAYNAPTQQYHTTLPAVQIPSNGVTTTTAAPPHDPMGFATNYMAPNPSKTEQGQPQHPGLMLPFIPPYGLPAQSMLPVFERDRESDFALLKMALDNLTSGHRHLTEQYKYQLLLGHLKLPSALQLAKAYMYHPPPPQVMTSFMNDPLPAASSKSEQVFSVAGRVVNLD